MKKITRPKILSLCSSAGGFDMGLHMAGFEVHSTDIDTQPNNPFYFRQVDALTVDLSGYEAYHGSPPCQGYTRLRHLSTIQHPKLLGDLRHRFLAEAPGVPYVMENVEDAKDFMVNPSRICGSALGMRIRRHRLIEANWGLQGTDCDHKWQELHKPYKIYVGKSRTDGLGYRESGIQPVHGGNHNVGGNSHFMKSVAMGIDWMTEHELNEAVPPAYGLYVGRQLMAEVLRRRESEGKLC